MKRLLLILILTLSFQPWTKADDIRDFQIEGMSIGDSLLDFFNKKDINRDYVFPNKEYATHADAGKNFETYEGFQVFYKNNDEKYRIEYIAGKILYENNIKECYKKMFQIVEEIKKTLPNTSVTDDGMREHVVDKSGKSKVHQVFFSLMDGEIVVSCYDWDIKMQKDGTHTDTLSISLRSSEFENWLTHEAYK